MRVDLMIARRLKLKERGSRRSAVSIRISIAGVVLSVTIMLLTIAVVTGFKHQITEKIVGFDSQISLTSIDDSYQRQSPITLTDNLRYTIEENLPQAEISLSIIQPAMLKTADNFSAVVFRGYDKNKNTEFLNSNIVSGVLPNLSNDSASNMIVLPLPVAKKLKLDVGDKINTCFFIDGKMRLRNFIIAALYQSNFGEYDEVVAFAPLSTLQRLNGLKNNTGTRIEISGLEFKNITEAQTTLQAALNSSYLRGATDTFIQTESVMQSGAIYFNWLALLDTNVIVVIILMSAISVFTLIASLFILILERVSMIGTLKTIGASNSLIRRIFILLASKIMLSGLVLGNLIALGIILLQYKFRLLPLNPESYYISFVPVKISIVQIIILNVAAIIISISVMIVPSMIISRMNPSRTVRFE